MFLRYLLPLTLLAASTGSAPADAQTAPAVPRGTIAITFDDAPRGDGAFFTGSERTRALIDALDRADVDGAMIFVTGRNAEARADGLDRLQAYAAAGHSLANHSYSHTWLWQSEPDDYLADLDRTTRLLEALPGHTPYFRFPFLDEGRTVEGRDVLRHGLAERGLRNGYVTVDNYDWYMDALVQRAVAAGREVDMDALRQAYIDILLEGIDFYDTLARETLDRSPAHVLLLHENDLAALFIDDLAAALREAGWQIVPAQTAYADPIADMLPDTLFNGQGRVAALAHAAGLRPAREMIPPFEDEAWLEAEFARRGVFSSAD